MSDEKKPTDWASDVKRYVPDADDGVIAKIVSYCGIALRTRDASMVSFSDKKETDRVRENFCKKKLALEEPDDVIDAAIAKVGERMSDTNYRNRVTVYYLLAEHFGKLSLFAGTKGAAAKGAAGAGTAAAAAAAAATPVAALAAMPDATSEAATAAAETAPAPVPAAPAPASVAAPVAAAAAVVAAAPLAAATLPPGVRGVYTLRSTRPVRGGAAAAGAGGSGDDFIGLAAAIFAGAAVIMIAAAVAGSYIGGRFDKEPPPPPAPVAPAPAAPAAPAEPAAPVIPDGAGIVSEVVDGRPKVSVFFDVGKAEVAPDFAAAVAPIKAWLDANPDDRAQLSGFTDPTGNAAANAELAKQRAQAVAAALAEQGVSAERMDLVKPADSSDEATDLAGARRVEITVTPG